MKILLAKAPRDRYSYFRDGGESLALGYLAAFLRSHGHSVNIVDGQIERLSIQEMVIRSTVEDHELIGFTIADPTFMSSTYLVAKAIRDALPSAHLTIGGYAPTFHYSDVLNQCSALDSVIRNEGELTLLCLVEALQNCQEWKQIPGIAYRNNTGIVCNDSRPLIPNLDSLPFPARDYLPYIKQNLPEFGIIAVSGSRGCYGSCGFCSIRRFYSVPDGAAFRLRSVSNVVDEIEEIVSKFCIDEFLLIDDIFTLPGLEGERRVAEWTRELNKRNLSLMFSISDRVDHIHRSLYDALYNIGVRQVMIGIEATNANILKYFNKKMTPESVKKAMDILEALNIDATITYINFTPLTTLEILRENLSHLLSLRVNFLLGLLNRLQIYVGTPIADDLMRNAMVTGEFPEFAYRIPDVRVEAVYEICRQCFSPFLEISYEIMKLERIFRVKIFHLEKMGQNSERVLKGRLFFKRTSRTIMEEAGDLFGMALDYADRHESLERHFLVEMRNRVQERYKLWHRELAFLRDYSPFFQDSDRILLV